jgi:predicted outer membrane protein
MRMRRTRRKWFGGRYTPANALLAGAMALTIASLVFPAVKGLQFAAASGGAPTVATAFGPMTQADRDFVVQVRLAGLWEYPAGQLALAKGSNVAYRTMGRRMMDGHAALDALCKTVAAQLGITLPERAAPQADGFVAVLSAASGDDFDRKLAMILRAMDGQSLMSVAGVRATTQNTLVRQLAGQANAVFLAELDLLDQTGATGSIGSATSSPLP